MSFIFSNKEIPEVLRIEPAVHKDERGLFEETFKVSEFRTNHINFSFVQDNHSFSKKGVVRGLHFQRKPHEQGKLVYAIIGKIFDVAVDLRKSSKTFGKWVYEELSGDNHRMLWIPPGFAHGFMALEDSHVIYKVTNEYDPASDDGILWNDPDVGIMWPKISPVVSDKDKALRSFQEYRKNMAGDSQ